MRSLLSIAIATLLSVPAFANITVSPGYISFGQTKIGAGGYNQRGATVHNQGQEATRVSVGGYCADFRVNTSCYNLPRYGSCNVNVSFKPTNPGSKSCSISITDQKTGRVTYITATGTGVR